MFCRSQHGGAGRRGCTRGRAWMAAHVLCEPAWRSAATWSVALLLLSGSFARYSACRRGSGTLSSTLHAQAWSRWFR